MLAALAQIALRCDYPGPRGDRAPRWICDLSDTAVASIHAVDDLRHRDLIAWKPTGWTLTPAGWRVLDAAGPAAIEA
jgi:hypothetical protein